MNNLKSVYKYLFENRLSNSKKLCTLFGPVAAGKSTLVNNIKYLGVKHSTPDDILELFLDKLKSDPSDTYTDMFNRHPDKIYGPGGLRNKSLDIATKRLNTWTESTTKHIMMDGTGAGYQDWYREEIYVPFQAKNFKILIAVLYVPLEVSISRDISRGEKGGRSLGTKISSDVHTNLIKSIPEYKRIADEMGLEFIIIKGQYDASAINDYDDEILNNYRDDIYSFDQGLKYIEKFYTTE